MSTRETRKINNSEYVPLHALEFRSERILGHAEYETPSDVPSNNWASKEYPGAGSGFPQFLCVWMDANIRSLLPTTLELVEAMKPAYSRNWLFGSTETITGDRAGPVQGCSSLARRREYIEYSTGLGVPNHRILDGFRDTWTSY